MKTIIVTGASSGIGRATALELAQRGHTVFATGRRVQALEHLRDEAGGKNVIPLALDVTDSASIQQVVDEVHTQTDGRGVDVLINNAGYAVFGPLLEIDDAMARRQFDVNVFGLLAMTRAFADAMLIRGSGRIINVSSIGGRVVFPFDGIYHSTKFAVEALSDALRIELAPLGVQVVLIEPGIIRTEFLDASDRSAIESSSTGSRFQVGKDVFTKAIEMLYSQAPGPEIVVRAMVHAVEARKPKSRYMMPFRERAMVFFYEHIIPTWVLDALFLWLQKAMTEEQQQPSASQPRTG